MLTGSERHQETLVGGTVTSQLEQESMVAQPPCSLRGKWAGGALSPQ
jgi:hypothetical protein